MVRFFVEGGWAMWPVLIFGMVTIGSAIRFVQRPETAQLKFVAAIGLTTLMFTIHATWMNLGSTFRSLEDPERVPDAELVRTIFAGLKESTRAGTLGLHLLAAACLLVAIGFLRAKQKTAAA